MKISRTLSKVIIVRCVVLNLLFWNADTRLWAQSPPNSQCTGAGILAAPLKISSTTGCTPLRVVTSTGGANVKNVRYIYYYKGGAPVEADATKDSSFTYKIPGTYFVMQLAENAQGQTMRACATIVVQDTIAPNFQVKFCSSGLATLLLPTDKSNIYDNYGVDWGDGSVQIVLKNAKNVTHRYSEDRTYRVSVQGIHNAGKCGGYAVKPVTATIVKDAPKLSRIELTSPTSARLVVSNPYQLDLLIYSQSDTKPYTSTGRTTRKVSDTLNVLVDSTRYLCFKATPMDTCVSKLESNVICSSVLKALTIDDERNFIAIIPYPQANQVQSVSVLRDDKPWRTLNPTDTWIEDFSPNCKQPSCYRVQITLQNGVVVTNQKCLNPPLGLCGELGDIYVPDSFTPNGDGRNDLLEVKGDITKDYLLTIFNRNGSPIFQSNSPVRSWDGRTEGQLVSSGYYFYHIMVKDRTGRSFVKTGSVMVMR